ncbi:MAG: hypothetical protein LBR64_05355 [Dysgonamonadaceae bacterium]|jgi:hypothetical protein|nr:hypothetical protein [Dysgonamonadaceae bacterium]
MKIIRNKYLPFRGFRAVNLFNLLLVRKEAHIDETLINHEKIHTAQMLELGFVFFYPLYMIEWLIRLIINRKWAYFRISFEREAYENQDNPGYLKQRKPYSFIKYL